MIKIPPGCVHLASIGARISVAFQGQDHALARAKPPPLVRLSPTFSSCSAPRSLRVHASPSSFPMVPRLAHLEAEPTALPSSCPSYMARTSTSRYVGSSYSP